MCAMHRDAHIRYVVASTGGAGDAFAFAFLLDTRAAISLWTAHWILTLCTCVQFGVYFVFVKKFFVRSFFLFFFLSRSLLSVFSARFSRFAAIPFGRFLFSHYHCAYTGAVCVCAFECMLCFNSIEWEPPCYPIPFLYADMHLYKCARLRRYYKIAYIMSSFVTRHTRAQLTTENVVFDKVLLLLVLFGVGTEQWRERVSEYDGLI